MKKRHSLCGSGVLFVLIAAVGWSCAGGPARPGGEEQHAPSTGLLGRIEGAEWHAVRLVVAGGPVELAADHVPTLAVDADGKVSGLATLNRYFGQMELRDGGGIHWAGPMGSTMMAGPEPLMDQEVRFLQALQSARKASLRDGALVLEDEGGESVLEFRR